MLKPLHNNLLLKSIEKENTSKIIFKDTNDEYEIINVSAELDHDLIGKKVIIKDYLKKVEDQGIQYFLVDFDDVLAIIE